MIPLTVRLPTILTTLTWKVKGLFDITDRSIIELTRELVMGTELDLHRLTVEEAIPKIDTFLNDTYCAGLHYVRIIHGKGSGILRQEVGRYLTTHPLVKSHHSADRYGGGIGATEVVLIDR